jgi:hypothetical protein
MAGRDAVSGHEPHDHPAMRRAPRAGEWMAAAEGEPMTPAPTQPEGTARHDEAANELPGGLSPRWVSGEKYDRAYAHANHLSKKVAALTEAVLAIDSAALPLAGTEDGWVAVGYYVPIWPLHKALGVIGHSSAKNIDHQPPEWWMRLLRRAVERTGATEVTESHTSAVGTPKGKCAGDVQPSNPGDVAHGSPAVFPKEHRANREEQKMTIAVITETDLTHVTISSREDDNWHADTEFIAHAREDIPALLAEIERLRAIEVAATELTEFYGWTIPVGLRRIDAHPKERALIAALAAGRLTRG